MEICERCEGHGYLWPREKEEDRCRLCHGNGATPPKEIPFSPQEKDQLKLLLFKKRTGVRL